MPDGIKSFDLKANILNKPEFRPYERHHIPTKGMGLGSEPGRDDGFDKVTGMEPGMSEEQQRLLEQKLRGPSGGAQPNMYDPNQSGLTEEPMETPIDPDTGMPISPEEAKNKKDAYGLIEKEQKDKEKLLKLKQNLSENYNKQGELGERMQYQNQQRDIQSLASDIATGKYQGPDQAARDQYIRDGLELERVANEDTYGPDPYSGLTEDQAEQKFLADRAEMTQPKLNMQPFYDMARVLGAKNLPAKAPVIGGGKDTLRDKLMDRRTKLAAERAKAKLGSGLDEKDVNKGFVDFYKTLYDPSSRRLLGRYQMNVDRADGAKALLTPYLNKAAMEKMKAGLSDYHDFQATLEGLSEKEKAAAYDKAPHLFVNEVSTVLATILRQGVATEGGVKHVIPEAIAKDIKGFWGYLRSKPTAAGIGQHIRNIEAAVDREKAINRAKIENRIQGAENAWGYLRKYDSVKFQDMVDGLRQDVYKDYQRKQLQKSRQDTYMDLPAEVVKKKSKKAPPPIRKGDPLMKLLDSAAGAKK